jgi:hypothetical protein
MHHSVSIRRKRLKGNSAAAVRTGTHGPMPSRPALSSSAAVACHVSIPGRNAIRPPIDTEFRLLAALTGADDTIARDMSACEQDRIDWSMLVELSVRHRVEALVGANLGRLPHDLIPADVRAHFERRLREEAFRGLHLSKATLEITSILAAAGIPCLLLKGCAVSHRFYDSPHARHSIDIDILIPVVSRHPAHAAIESLGFEKTETYRSIPEVRDDVLEVLGCDISYGRGADAVQLELHWRLDRNTEMLSWDFGSTRSMHMPMKLGGESVLVFASGAQFVYLLCHGAKHAWFRLKWLADIDRMSRQLSQDDFELALQLIRRAGVERLAATSLQLLYEVYGTPAGSHGLSALSPHVDKRLLAYMRTSLLKQRVRPAASLLDLSEHLSAVSYGIRLKPGLRYKSATIMSSVVDIGDIATLGLSKRWLWLYPIVGPLLAATRLARRQFAPRAERSSLNNQTRRPDPPKCCG